MAMLDTNSDLHTQTERLFRRKRLVTFAVPAVRWV